MNATFYALGNGLSSGFSPHLFRLLSCPSSGAVEADLFLQRFKSRENPYDGPLRWLEVKRIGAVSFFRSPRLAPSPFS